MLLLKQRLFALIIALVSGGVLYWTWHDALHNNGYYLKAALFAPVGIVMGIFLILFPQFSGKPETAREKIVTLSVFAVGILFGLGNWYLIDAGNIRFLLNLLH